MQRCHHLERVCRLSDACFLFKHNYDEDVRPWVSVEVIEQVSLDLDIVVGWHDDVDVELVVRLEVLDLI